ncbi:sugar transferase [Halioxenophilus aromaticivorans]|uniref:Bacterial sugar transferase domain-containing protein n=1 Tax=Halioxenophilus aromaticivorans TaxID=1306992 RepID=A0AAV3UAR3_9ALTE
MTKRGLDSLLAINLLLILAIPIFWVLFVVWLTDRACPVYVSWRTGKNKRPFKLYKIRTMVPGADVKGTSVTTANDSRITAVGRLLRASKLDELPQLINILKGDMSFVGPRPNVKAETDLYSSAEQDIFLHRPGITDLSSIIFFDEERILAEVNASTQFYHCSIRPIKNRIAILYANNRSLVYDIKIIYLTFLSVFNRQGALKRASQILSLFSKDKWLANVAVTGGDVLLNHSSQSRYIKRS